MLDAQLAGSLGIERNILPIKRRTEFLCLASQTTPQERESLYAVTKFAYTGEGDIWDIGCAAGGSSYCLAAGLQDKPAADTNCTVKCFDLFAGYSRNWFRRRFKQQLSDLEIFHKQTKSVQEFVTPVKMNLKKGLDSYTMERPVEIAHIDAAKSLELWKAIFEKLSSAIIPGKTIWIFQDFDRARLPWQIYGLAEMIDSGEILGGARYGTLYFRFKSPLNDSVKRKIINDDFSMEVRTSNIRSLFQTIRANHASFFPEHKAKIADLENTALAYCYHWQGDVEQAREILKNTSSAYLSKRYNKIYSQDILGD